MQILSIDNARILENAVSMLKNKGTVVYPTETCYGLGCDPEDGVAVEKIFQIKGRDKNKPVLLIAHNVSAFLDYVEWNETLQDLARAYWPGPLTIITSVKVGSKLAPGVKGGDHTVAIRVTSHPFASRLTEAFGRPIVSTSANLSGLESPYTIHSVTEMFNGREHTPDLIIDAGDLPIQKPSTIVRIESDGRKTVVRQGGIVIQ